jgi:hypothetical protein
MKNLLFAFLCLMSLVMLGSCNKNNDVDPTAWIDLLDTSVNAAQKASLRALVSAGLDPARMEATSKLYTKASEFYTALSTAKSIYHQRVLINDRVSAIPGITKGLFAANGLPRTLILAAPADSLLNLPAAEAPNFVEAKDTVLTAGTKIYRVIGGSGSFSTGGYWVLTRPTNYAEIIGGTAVQPEWNGFNVIVEYTVPTNSTMKVWKGRASRQLIAGTTNKYYPEYQTTYHLAGGGVQIFVPNVYRDFRDSVAYNRFLKNITKLDSITWVKD